MTQLSNSAADAATKTKGGIKGLMKGRSDVFSIDPRVIEIDPTFNARDFTTPSNKAHVEWLEGSIEEEGVKEPLKIRMRGDVPVCTNGESRLRAIMNLIKRGVNIETVPVRTEDRASNDADRLMTQLTSNSGKRFETMEQSDLFAKMVKLGLDADTIAKRANMDKRRVQQLLDLQSLPIAVQKLIRSEKVSASLAMETFIKSGRDEAKTIADMEGAVENAVAAGRNKATKKHVGGEGGERKPSEGKRLKVERQQVIDLFEGVIVEGIELSPKEVAAGEVPTSTVVIETAKWEKIVALLGL